MSGKNKGGRETRKPKQEHNKKSKGQTPSPGTVLGGVQPPASPQRHSTAS